MRKSSLKFYTAMVLALVFLNANPGNSQPVLDQVSSFEPHTNPVYASLRYRDIAQSFTVGITGFLTKIELPLLRNPSMNSTIVVDIRKTHLGLPIESNIDILGFIEIPFTEIGTTLPRLFVPLDGFRIFVEQGDILAMVFRLPFQVGNDGEISTSLLSNNIYTGGSAYLRDNFDAPGIWKNTNSEDFDLVFKTFISQRLPAVTEPSALIAFTIAYLLIVIHRIRFT